MANRLSVIRDLTTKDQWKYISTENNPADTASQGLHIDTFLRSKLWFNGPDFLSKDKGLWPQCTKEFLPIDPDDMEVKSAQVNIATIMENPISKLIEHYSQWTNLKRAVAWLLKLKDILKTKLKRRDEDNNEATCHEETKRLSMEDLGKAEQAIILYIYYIICAAAILQN